MNRKYRRAHASCMCVEIHDDEPPPRRSCAQGPSRRRTVSCRPPRSRTGLTTTLGWGLAIRCLPTSAASPTSLRHRTAPPSGAWRPESPWSHLGVCPRQKQTSPPSCARQHRSCTRQQCMETMSRPCAATQTTWKTSADLPGCLRKAASRPRAAGVFWSSCLI